VAYDGTSVVVERRSQFMEVRANEMEPVHKPAPRRHIDDGQTLLHVPLPVYRKEQAQAKCARLLPLRVLKEGQPLAKILSQRMLMGLGPPAKLFWV
jgi:hypothetical protein